MTRPTPEFLAMLRGFPAAADAAELAGHGELAIAYQTALCMFLQACADDGIEVDPADVGFMFGIIDDDF
jgi:hypothetical protein